jgi:L-asparagine transporter-like permease
MDWNWKLRQFIKPQVIIGINRQNSIGDRLTINEGIQGFNSAIYGTSKMIMTLQTQAYAPKDIGGFRLNPYFNYSIAL